MLYWFFSLKSTYIFINILYYPGDNLCQEVFKHWGKFALKFCVTLDWPWFATYLWNSCDAFSYMITSDTSFFPHWIFSLHFATCFYLQIFTCPEIYINLQLSSTPAIQKKTQNTKALYGCSRFYRKLRFCFGFFGCAGSLLLYVGFL